MLTYSVRNLGQQGQLPADSCWRAQKRTNEQLSQACSSQSESCLSTCWAPSPERAWQRNRTDARGRQARSNRDLELASSCQADHTFSQLTMLWDGSSFSTSWRLPRTRSRLSPLETYVVAASTSARLSCAMPLAPPPQPSISFRIF
jgi:hypothetical protein